MVGLDTQKIRILYLTRGGQVAGSQRQLNYLLKHLDNCFEPVVFFDRGGEFHEQIKQQGILCLSCKLPPWRKFPKGVLRYCYAESLVQQAREFTVGLVHCNDLWLSGYMRWIAYRLGIPSVLHVRTPISTRDAYKHGCDKASALIAISRRTRRGLLEANISRQKILRINDSVDLKAFYSKLDASKLLREQYKVDDSVVIGLVGRIELSKGQLEFLKVAEKIIKKSKRPVKFWFVGPARHSDYRDHVQQFIREKDLQEHVLLMGQREDMPEVLNAMDILVTFSGGSVMFEAAACGKPIVSMYPENSTAQSLQYINSRPILVAKGRDEMEEVLLRLIANPSTREDVGSKSRRWAEQSFDCCQMALKTQKLYKKLLSQDQ
jgi:glycosyltransferase involved in cell wall biosynthesis